MSSKTQKQQNKNAESGAKLKEALTHAMPVSDEVQKELNQPLEAAESVEEKNAKFFKDLLAKLEDGSLNLLIPSTLMNSAVYDKLSEKKQGEVDLNAVSLLARLRDIKSLHDLGSADTYQMENLIEQVRLTKEQLEKKVGDVFVI
jgi:hypothetical protein